MSGNAWSLPARPDQIAEHIAVRTSDPHDCSVASEAPIVTPATPNLSQFARTYEATSNGARDAATPTPGDTVSPWSGRARRLPLAHQGRFQTDWCPCRVYRDAALGEQRCERPSDLAAPAAAEADEHHVQPTKRPVAAHAAHGVQPLAGEPVVHRHRRAGRHCLRARKCRRCRDERTAPGFASRNPFGSRAWNRLALRAPISFPSRSRNLATVTPLRSHSQLSAGGSARSSVGSDPGQRRDIQRPISAQTTPPRGYQCDPQHAARLGSALRDIVRVCAPPSFYRVL